MLFEVDFLEVWVDVEAFGAEVVGAGDVWDDALPGFPDRVVTHPHVPVPHLTAEETRHCGLNMMYLAKHCTNKFNGIRRVDVDLIKSLKLIGILFTAYVTFALNAACIYFSY